MRRRAVTLVELLVVITIILILAVIVLPRLGLNSKGRKVREASRMVSVFLNRAKTQAVESGRACGVEFAESNSGDRFATVLRIVQVPELYAGDMENVEMQPQTISTNGTVRVRIQVASLADKLLRVGDKIKFGMQGYSYKILPSSIPVDSEGYLKFSDLPDTEVRPEEWLSRWYDEWIAAWLAAWKAAHPGQTPPQPPIPPDPPPVPSEPDGWVDDSYWLVCQLEDGARRPLPWHDDTPTQIHPGWGPTIKLWANPVPFQIQRPYQPTISMPLVLPTGTAVDLTATGFPDQSVSPDTLSRFVVMFSTTGNLSKIYWTDQYGAQESVPSGSVYLLVGLVVQVPSQLKMSTDVDPNHPDTPEEGQANWRLMNSKWIGINHATGMSAVAGNTPTPVWDGEKRGNSLLGAFPRAHEEARAEIKSARVMGGR